MSRFPTAGWEQCCSHGIIKEGKGLLTGHMGKGSVPDSRLGTVVYTESLKRVKGCSYSELVMSVKGRFPTASWIQCCSYVELVMWVKGRFPTAGWVTQGTMLFTRNH